MSNLPKTKNLVSIGQAAGILGVSIDTLRRWDKKGKVTSIRPDGKNRLFYVSELESLKNKENSKLSISQASSKIGVSASTLRRYEKKGLIKPGRNNKGERLYTNEVINAFKKGGSKRKEQEKSEQSKAKKTIKKKIIRKVERIRIRQQYNNYPTFLIVVLLITTIFSTLYIQDKYRSNYDKVQTTYTKVLGAKDEGGVIGFFGKISDIIKATNSRLAAQYKSMFGIGGIANVNEIFEYDEEGNIVPKVTINITQPELFKIKETVTVIQNLDADSLRGKIPGELEGDLAVFSSGGRITGLRVSSSSLLAGSVSGGTGGVILDSSITSADLADGAVSSSEILNGTIINADIADGAINSAKIEDGTIVEADLSDGSVTTGKIASDTITAADLSATITLSDGDFLDLAAIVHNDSALQGLRLPNVSSASPTSLTSGEGFLAYDTAGDQVLVYDGSSWVGIGGSVTLATGSGLEYVAEELTIDTSCGDGQVMKWNNGASDWECGDDSGAVGSSLQAAYGSGNTITTTNGKDVVITLDDTATDSNLDINIIADNTVSISRNDGASVEAPSQLLLVENLDTDLTITDGILVNVATGGVVTDAVDVSDAEIVNAINIGGNAIAGTNFSVTAGGVITASDISCGSTTCITLGTETGGNYVASVTSGSGISGGDGGSEDAGLTLSLGALTANWSQTGAFDIVLGNAASELQILESAGATYYGTLDVGNLSADATYTFSGTTGTVLTTANYTTTLDSDYVDVDESPASADISGTFSTGLTIGANSVVLGTDTTENYVDNVTGGNGIVVTGTPGEGWEPAVAVDLLAVQDGSGSTFSYSGLEMQGTSSDKLTLLQGCSDGQILKWDDESGGNGRWDCAADVSGGGGVFAEASGVITKVTAGDRLNLVYGDAADVQLTIDSSTNTIVPTADALVLDLTSGATNTGIVTDGVDGLVINIEFGDEGTNQVNSAIHLNVDPVAIATSDDTFYAINIDGLTAGTSATETAISIGANWDTEIVFVDTTPTISIGDTGTLSITDGTNTLFSIADNSNAATLFIANASSAPGSCTEGEIYTNSANNNIYYCETTNTWVDLTGGGAGGAWSDLTDPAGALTLAHGTNATTMGFTPTAALNAWTFDITNEGASTTVQNGLVINNTVTGTFTDLNTESLLLLDNEDTTAASSTIVDNGLLVTVSGAIADGIVDAIDVSDANITNAINIGANAIAGTNFSVSTAGAITAPTSTDTINGLIINSGALSGISTIGLSGAISGGTTLGLSGAISGQTSTDTINGLIINSGAVSGATTIAASGTVTIGGSGDTFTFDPSAGPTYAGAARPLITWVLSPEYPGATLFGDGGTNTGTMTSDSTDATATGNRANYYEWNSAQTAALNDYDVVVRFTLPSDFAAWEITTDTTIVFDFATNSTTVGQNQIDVDIREESSDTIDASQADMVSSVAATWTTAGIDESELTLCNAAGETCTINFKMQSKDGDWARLGDITMKYRAKF